MPAAAPVVFGICFYQSSSASYYTSFLLISHVNILSIKLCGWRAQMGEDMSDAPIPLVLQIYPTASTPVARRVSQQFRYDRPFL